MGMTAAKTQLIYTHENGTERVLTPPVEPSIFRVIPSTDKKVNFTNGNHYEAHVFSSFWTVHVQYQFMTWEEYFTTAVQSSFQHFYQIVKRMSPWGFALDYDKKFEATISVRPTPGTQSLVVSNQNFNPDDWIYVTNARGDHEVFNVVNRIGNTLTLYPTMALQYEVGEYVRIWGYFPKLVYTGGDFNDGWDETGLYFSTAEIIGRMVVS
jgi:hypothetical protein